MINAYVQHMTNRLAAIQILTNQIIGIFFVNIGILFSCRFTSNCFVFEYVTMRDCGLFVPNLKRTGNIFSYDNNTSFRFMFGTRTRRLSSHSTFIYLTASKIAIRKNITSFFPVWNKKVKVLHSGILENKTN